MECKAFEEVPLLGRIEISRVAVEHELIFSAISATRVLEKSLNAGIDVHSRVLGVGQDGGFSSDNLASRHQNLFKNDIPLVSKIRYRIINRERERKLWLKRLA
jgi:hypothetical protein